MQNPVVPVETVRRPDALPMSPVPPYQCSDGDNDDNDDDYDDDEMTMMMTCLPTSPVPPSSSAVRGLASPVSSIPQSSIILVQQLMLSFFRGSLPS